MTKATIITNHGAGEYTVQLELNTVRAQQLSDDLQQRILDITQIVLDAQTAVLDARQALNDKLAEINAAIIAEADTKTINALLVEGYQARARYESAKIEADHLVANKLSLSRAKTTIDNHISAATQPQIRIWCADYSENLSGTVSVIVMPAENTGADLVIRPGFTDGAAWDQSIHGWLTPPWSQTAAQAYYNYAMLPGVQKWLPTYRYGTISNLSGNTCDVAVESAVSSAQGLGVNKETSLSGVQIEYMDCNQAAFQNGDRVVVRFDGKDKNTPEQNWDNPKVIGFVESPRPCEKIAVAGRTSSSPFIMACYIFDLNFVEQDYHGNQLGTGIAQNDAVMRDEKLWINAVDTTVVPAVPQPTIWQVIPPGSSLSTSDGEGIIAFNAYGDYFYCVSSDQHVLTKYDASANFQARRTLVSFDNPGYAFAVAAKRDKVAVLGFDGVNNYKIDLYDTDLAHLLTITLNSSYDFASRGLAMSADLIATVGNNGDQKAFFYNHSGNLLATLVPSGEFQGSPAVFSLDDVALSDIQVFLGGGRVFPGIGLESQLVREYEITYTGSVPSFSFVADYYPQDLPEEDFGHEYTLTRLDIG